MAKFLLKKLPVRCKLNKTVFLSRFPVIGVKINNYTTTNQQEPSLADSGFSEVEVTVGFENRENMVLRSGKLAKLANGCALVTLQDTTVMATVVSKEKKNESWASFVPLTVFYQLKAAALGRIPLNFFRRELGQNEHEILTSRMIDRSIRPLFPKGFNWETQVICNPLAIDGKNFPDVLAINAASAALAVSDIPFEYPVGAVRVGFIDQQPVINPTKLELKESELNLVMAVRRGKMVTMIDGSAAGITQSSLFKCVNVGAKECQKVLTGIEKLQKLAGKEKRTFQKPSPNPDLVSEVHSLAKEKLRGIYSNVAHDKLTRDEEIFQLHRETIEGVSKALNGESTAEISEIFTNTCKEVLKDLVFETDVRCDGRKPNDLRTINCEVDLYKPLHGSALFQRGQTQVFCTVSLDSPHSALKMDKVSMLSSGLKDKNFFVHYEFPPFATNETKRMGPIGRREIGHGALAEKALRSSIPSNFPFTIRLTSEVLESNGSSSMATVCGGTLALMDAGVPITNLCAGVAMGLLIKTDENGEIVDYRILNDILGLEDFLGEIDFKIAGSKKTYTGFQLDVKNCGIPLKIIFEILMKAKESIDLILVEMKKVCPEVRMEKKSNWPEIQTVKVPIHMRSAFLGPGGANLKRLEMNIGVEITETEGGEFTVFAPNKEAMKEADDAIKELLVAREEFKLEFGGVYTALIREIKENGCLVTLYPEMKPVYVHVSQLDVKKVSHPSALGLKVGQEIRVKYFGRDPVSGAMRLSRKVLLGPPSEVVKTYFKNSEETAEAAKS